MLTLFNKTFDVLTGMLNHRIKRHKVLLSNVANMDVPGYRPSDVIMKKPFEGSYRAGSAVTMRITRENHISKGEAFSNQLADLELTTSEQKVSLDKEMTNLSENNLMFNATVEMLARKFRTLATVLKETK